MKKIDISFIDNSNIEIRDLWKDGIHLLESGKAKLAENFMYFLNNSHWLSPHDHTRGNIEHKHSQLLKTKNCESISNKAFLTQILQMKPTMRITIKKLE